MRDRRNKRRPDAQLIDPAEDKIVLSDKCVAANLKANTMKIYETERYFTQATGIVRPPKAPLDGVPHFKRSNMFLKQVKVCL